MQGKLKRCLIIVFYSVLFSPTLALGSNELFFEFEQAKTFESKLELANTLLNNSTTTNKQKAEIYISLADLSFKKNDYTNAINYFKALERITDKKFLPDQHFRAIKMQGVIFYYQGHFQKAIFEYSRAMHIANQEFKKIEQANLLSNIGLSYFQMGNMELTLKHYLDAKELYQAVGSKQDQSDILLNIAGVYIRLSRYDRALIIYKEVLGVYQLLNDESGIAQVYNNMGVAYYETNKYDFALHYYQLALRFYISANNDNKLSTQYNNLATVNLILNNVSTAYEQAQLALDYAKKISNHSLELAALHTLAQIQFMQGDLAQAKVNNSRSTLLAKKYDNERLLIDGLAIKSLIQAGSGEYVDAIVSNKHFADEQKRLRSQAIVKGLALLQNEFKATQLNQEIEQLKQERQVQSLKMSQRNQSTVFVFLVLILLGTLGVAIYRRNSEKRAKQQLAEQVEQRTIELQNVAKELRKANEVKSQFLANISHEIRTPLTAILGQADDLMKGLYKPEQLQSELQVIHRQGEHLKSLINDVLDLSKIEANRLELNASRFDFVQLVTDIHNMFISQANSKGLKLILNNNISEHFYTQLDAIRIKQILINLYANALKFTAQGSITLVLDRTDHGIVCVVKDTGIGMNNEQLKLIFEYFKQADNSISRRFGGTGLGLSLSQQLATMMGGYISVKSEYKKGSQFSFYVPCTELPVESIELPHETTAFNKKSLSGKVLLAEDHDDNRRLISRYLRSLGLDVIVVENGEQAVEVCLKEYPDLVLLDIQMPVMDGIKALQLLKECAYQQPIFALTANVMSHEIDHYLALGFTDYLSKPIDKELFYNALAKYLKLDATKQSEIKNVDISDLVQSFKQSFTVERSKIARHAEQNDFDNLKKDAHRLLGAAKMFGVIDVSEAANDLEKGLQRKDVHQINVLTNKLLSVLLKYER
ncbi:tetratricopeptide repeat protein [Pseudoalteromonas sp. MMG010]|uniref:tetratricopeptide repeat-containing hybrid sensor histidine kinase/response regulator n=1 Tax=Pseudoalteromonas sp. MMG010 TaxID=2822685 RepID=UPI001B3A40F7|nr:tetratricopeptide repeat protein [Pseudoalteromonas sp. MMG010]MBQ4834121.1 tetratricopeptide repeat protein [Pseudoalteromonas sp. MMG010]